MIPTEVVLEPPQTQDQTGYGSTFSRPQAVSRSVAVDEPDDTGLDGDFVLDPPGGSWQAAPSIQLLGERFRLEVDEELGIVISHPKWSLMGCGRTVAEAEKMVMEYARDLAEAMIADSPTEYTEEGNRLREFVLGFLYLSSD